MNGKKLNVLFIDNFDSFTYNLVDEFEKRKCNVTVYRSNTPISKLREVVKKFRPGLIVISPGPGSPEESGASLAVLNEFSGKIPIFGVCLGLQAMTIAFGGKVSKSVETIHGKASRISHDGKTIFTGIESPFSAGRYHSLVATRVPDDFEVSAFSESGLVMALRHRKFFVEGVQFHPESILTPTGGKIISNLIKLCQNSTCAGGAQSD